MRWWRRHRDRRRRHDRRARPDAGRLVALALLLACAACHGGPHKRGEEQAIFRADVSEPISGTSLGFEGMGDARNVGVGAGFQAFVLDRWAIGGSMGLRYFDQSGGGVAAFDLEFTARHYLFEVGKLGVIFEFNGGRSIATEQYPPGGTTGNWIFGFGPTFEYPLGDRTSLLLGYQWRHLSNGKGNVPENPTQNDHRVWAGVGIKW
ncbi:MAG: hypothetical protein ACYTGN_07310 [Planctomycetota bacterium]